MDGFELTASLAGTFVWPAVLTVGACFIYRKRNVFGDHIVSLLKRLSNFKGFGVELSLVESKELPSRNKDIVTSHYSVYTNGVIQEKITIKWRPGEKRMLVYPVAFPRTVLSFQFIGCAPMPIVEANNGNCILDGSQLREPIEAVLLITGM